MCKANLVYKLGFLAAVLTGCATTNGPVNQGTERRGIASEASSSWIVNDSFDCFGIGPDRAKINKARAHLHFKDSWQFVEMPTLSITYTGGKSVNYLVDSFDNAKSKSLRDSGLTQAWVAVDSAKAAQLNFFEFSSLGAVLVGFKIDLITAGRTVHLDCGNETIPTH